ncbi:Proline-specific permease ProY [compost metagenome]
MVMRRSMSSEEVAKLHFPVPLWPVGPACAAAFMLFIFGVLAWFPDTRMALYVGIGWLALLSLGYWLFVARQPKALVAAPGPVNS